MVKRFSGRFLVRIPPDLHARLFELARAEGLSLNSLCVRLLGERLGGRSSGNGTSPFLGIPIEDLVHRLRKAGVDLEAIYLFGSVARRESRAGSDFDLLFVLSPALVPTREYYRLWDERVVPGMSRSLSPHFVALPTLAEEAGGLWYEVAIDGIPLWDPTARVAVLLAEIRRRMAEGKLVRRVRHGHGYWLKADAS